MMVACLFNEGAHPLGVLLHKGVPLNETQVHDLMRYLRLNMQHVHLKLEPSVEIVKFLLI